MKTRIAIKRAVDVFMLSLFIYLMNYRAFGNLAIHAWAGITLFALFIVHNILNFQYWRTLAKGKYTAKRTILAVTNIALLFLMIAMAVSSCMMSRAIFYNSPFPMSWLGNVLHKLSTSWGFMVMAVHLSLHLQGVFDVIERHLFANGQRCSLKIIYAVCQAAIATMGMFSFYHSGLWRAMFLIRGHGRAYNPCIAIADYVLILLAAAIIARLFSHNKAK